MEREHGTVWVSIRNEVELAHKRACEATVTTLKNQVLKVDSFTKKIESAVWVSTRQIKELTYVFSQLRQKIERIDHLESERYGREDESLMGKPQCMGGSQGKGESPTNHAEIESIRNNLQELLNSHDNHISGEGVRMGEFAYEYFGYFKDDVLKEIPRGGFSILVDAWSICDF